MFGHMSNREEQNEKQEVFTSGGLVYVLNLKFLFQTQDPQLRLKKPIEASVCVCVCVVANRRKEVTVLGESLF